MHDRINPRLVKRIVEWGDARLRRCYASIGVPRRDGIRVSRWRRHGYQGSSQQNFTEKGVHVAFLQFSSKSHMRIAVATLSAPASRVNDPNGSLKQAAVPSPTSQLILRSPRAIDQSISTRTESLSCPPRTGSFVCDNGGTRRTVRILTALDAASRRPCNDCRCVSCRVSIHCCFHHAGLCSGADDTTSAHIASRRWLFRLESNSRLAPRSWG